MQGLQDSTQETLTDLLYGDIKYSIIIKASGPQIRIPALHHGYFLLDLGLIEIENPLNPENSEYDSFSFFISGVELNHETELSCESIITDLKIH